MITVSPHPYVPYFHLSFSFIHFSLRCPSLQPISLTSTLVLSSFGLSFLILTHCPPTTGVLGPAEVVYPPPTWFYNMLVWHHHVVVCPSESEYVHITIQNAHEYMACLSPFLTLTSCKSKQLFVTVTVNFIQKVFFSDN